MAASTSSGVPRAAGRGGDRPLHRYDLVLAVIPLAFALALTADVALAVPTPAALAVASALGGLAVVDALFVHPPT